MTSLKLVSGKNPRQIALRILQARRENGEFTETLLERALAPRASSEGAESAQNRTILPADRALCQELVYGVVRALSTLDWLIERKTGGRRQNAGIQNVLRLGLYQVFWLDRIPAHAAVHETVELAKQEGFGPKAGFVNAVLRGFLREFDATKKMLAELRESNPAVGFSHPQWLVERWEKRFGVENTRQMLEWNNTPPGVFGRVNTLKTDAGKLLEKWREENVDYDFVRRDFLQGHGREGAAHQDVNFDPETAIFALKSHPSLTSLGSFREGWFYVQDPSTLAAALELAPRPGETILDLCAAPGGKTTCIAQLMGNTGKIVAADVSEERLKLVRENCDRLGVTSVKPIQNSMLDDQPPDFDKILIDAPCSNTGVLRRRVDLRWRISEDELLRLQRAQLDLLKRAAPMLKSEGVLVYSTCSLEPEENSIVVQEFLRENKQFKLDDECELLPFKDQVDGAFVARLSKR
ncbi:MAG TPA: 16S rRNA (cytosine(967)-C(5))-methyltransferase RsmB [Verrucomicrobiae bacterium]|nr:16S rRNA (cytosine(967)-C(5))-methyltransferase RsmB [Verrucomicrobiae bacterium]